MFRVYDVRTLESRLLLTGHTATINDAAVVVVQNTPFIVTAGDDNTCRLFALPAEVLT